MQPGTFISNVELIFLTDVDAELIRCLYFILYLFRLIVLLYCTVLYSYLLLAKRREWRCSYGSSV